MRRLFLSDLHLWDAADRHFATFARLLARQDVDEIYLLGDLCEVWVGDDDDSPLARAIVAVIAGAARTRPVHVMAGNRDFLYGEQFARETGARLVPDP
jgi:UDP-2,3-diacylglucosamine hydrolase